MEHSISKTTLGDLVAGSRSVYWTDGDCISANGVTSQPLSGVGNNASTALFSFPSDPGTPYKLVYPASIWEADGRVTLPTVLNASSGAFDGLMYGYSADGGEATMHHMTAYARINVKKGAEEHTLRYVRLTGGAKEQLSGRFDIQYSTGELSPDDVSAAATKVFATVNATLTDEPTSVLIPVPEGTYSSGFTVRLVDSEGHYMDKSRGASVFEAGHIYNLDAFTFTPTGTLVTIDLPDTEEEAEQDLSPDEIASSISSYLSTSYPASVTSVSVSSTSVTIKGTAPTSSGYYLAEITPYQEVMTYSDDHLSQQAAGVCWAWKKIQALEGIDAMQWHAWRDNPEEGLNLGLRKNTDNGSATKPAWDAYQAAGTSSEDIVFAPYLPVIGISSWDQIML